MAASQQCMRTLLGAAGTFLTLLGASCASTETGTAPLREDGAGPVIAVGGGGTPMEVPTLALELARERFEGEPDVVVVPHASSRENRGVASAEMWREAGGASVAILSDDPDAARAQLEGAEVIWMGGGSQSRLLDHYEAQGLIEVVRDAHRRGAVIGGTSAGAAVLGSVTIAGSPDPAPYVRGSMERRPGLALVRDAIVDQHFAERRREGRLLTALFEGGAAIGFGVSEGTGAVFDGDGMRVIGRSSVLVMDAGALDSAGTEAGELMGARNLRVELVPTGRSWSHGDAGK